MARHFKRRTGGGASIILEAFEIDLLRDCAEQLLELLGPADGPAGDDPLAAALHHGPSDAPDDPALKRLFPDAYGDEDDEARNASAEFRRFTENDLRARKRTDALALIASLDAAGDLGRRGADVRLDADQCRHWLGTLNDLRLAFASRLGIGAEGDDRALLRLPDDDPRKATASVYFWLTWLQDNLVEAMMR
ncbi:DUF2017 domain-containing protein [Glycomyces harbinensis]|uniref:Uncharacterized protein n=1 Tax=Glycomyces harbinensis TaxID=58114 RepID=A0A1G6UDA0_9ACTN|nr:DUF2017 domain-containing protein [Glycomyces harbinensis]SDD39221.1 protein of unknown function [Glycomyces harbinensis]